MSRKQINDMKKKIVIAACLSMMVAFFAMSSNNNVISNLAKSNVEALVAGDNGYPEGKTVVLDIYDTANYGPADKVVDWDVMGNMTWCGEDGQHTQTKIGSCYAIVFSRN